MLVCFTRSSLKTKSEHSKIPNQLVGVLNPHAYPTNRARMFSENITPVTDYI